jgi:hypothetical protein
MTGLSRSPQTLDAGIVVVDTTTGIVLRIITFQYNPDSLSRSFQVQAVGDRADRSYPLRLKGPAVETIKLEAELDAADQLEFPDQNAVTVQVGLHPQIALLEGLVYPSVAQLVNSDSLADSGQLEILPVEAPMTIFVWSPNRLAPVRITELSVTEEAFDVNLNPLRAKVSLGMRVLSVSDVGYEHPAGTAYLAHQRRKEQLAAMAVSGSFSQLGITGLS